MTSEHFSLRLSKSTKQKLDELAKATGRSKAFLALDAIERYLEVEAWQINAIKEGICEAENNKTVSIDDIKADWKI